MFSACVHASWACVLSAASFAASRALCPCLAASSDFINTACNAVTIGMLLSCKDVHGQVALFPAPPFAAAPLTPQLCLPDLWTIAHAFPAVLADVSVR